MAVFETGAHRTLTDVFQTFNARGVEYGDSWSVENQVPGFVDAMREVVGEDRSRDANRLIRAAGLVDTKISRITSGGPFKRDSYVDLVAYLAHLCDLHEQYEQQPKPSEPAPALHVA
jgi:hypothetical protein